MNTLSIKVTDRHRITLTIKWIGLGLVLVLIGIISITSHAFDEDWYGYIMLLAGIVSIGYRYFKTLSEVEASTIQFDNDGITVSSKNSRNSYLWQDIDAIDLPHKPELSWTVDVFKIKTKLNSAEIVSIYYPSNKRAEIEKFLHWKGVRIKDLGDNIV